MTAFFDLFDPPPATWGLRGDPHLWHALRDRFAGHPLPGDSAELAAAVEAAFRDIVGQGWTGETPVAVAALRSDRGGMSNGLVSPPWWRETALPLLAERWRAASRAA